MKKFMILLLSLAVLFSFAACDNSSDTPANPDEPGTGLSDTLIETTGANIFNILTDDTDGLYAKFNADIMEDQSGTKVLKENYSAADPYTTITYTCETVPGSSALQGDTDVKYTLTGVDVTDAADRASSRAIRLTRYTVDFSTSVANGEGNYVDVSGSVSGAVVGTVAVTIGANGATAIVPAISDIIYPDTTSVSYGDEPVDNAKLVASITGSTTVSQWKTAAAYKTAKENDAKKLMNTYVEAITTSTGSDTLVARLTQFLGLESGVTKTYTDGTADTKASATISYTVPSGKYVIAGTANSATITNVTIKFEAANVGATTGTFDPATFELSGTFSVFSDKTATTAEDDFATITLDKVTGTAAKTSTAISGSNGVIASLGDVALTFAKGSATGTATANVLTKVGPAVSNGELAALGNVTLDYSKDSAVLN